jgi:PhnB protein
MAKAARPIPEGIPHLIPYLTIDNASEAINWYEKALGAELVQKMPGPDGNGVMHCEMKIGNARLYFADKFGPEGKSPKDLGGSPVFLHLWTEDCDALWKRATGAGAKVLMPLDDMFWGDRYGQVQDPFGHIWAISSQKESFTPAEMQERAAKAFS